MNFQGPRDLTPNAKHYQQVVSFLLDIQNRYPKIFEDLLQAPQFDYDVEIYRRKKSYARKYLLMLKNLVKQYERHGHPTINELKLYKSHMPTPIGMKGQKRVDYR